LALTGCQKPEVQGNDVHQPAANHHKALAEVQITPTKTALFGDVHVHTSQSFDAFVFGVRRTPEDA
jgi:hypothetical protein